jgi:hypothetical protein
METARTPPQGKHFGYARDPRIFGWHRLNPFKHIAKSIGHLLPDSELPKYYRVPRHNEDEQQIDDETDD